MSNELIRSEPIDPNTTLEEITSSASTDIGAEHGEPSLPSEGSADSSIPDKFKREDGSVDYEALAKSYGELEAKLSGGGSSDDEEDIGEDVVSEDLGPEDLSNQKEAVEDVLGKAELSLDDLTAEVDETGDLSQENYDKLVEASGFPEEMVRTYVRGLKNSQAAAQELTANSYESVGGEEAYRDMIAWAADNLTDAEIEAYDAAVGSYDKDRTMKAVATLKAKYDMHGPVEPATTVSGKASGSKDVYSSEAEFMDDMMDPRYDTSQAYREKVIAKRMRSDF